MEREVQFILIDTGSESNRINMSDVGKMKNALQISETHEHVNQIVDFFIRAHFSFSISKRILLPGKSIWKKYCVLENIITDRNVEYYVVVVNTAIHKFSVSYLNRLSQRENVHLYSLLLDSYEKLPKLLCKMIEKTNFEKVYSFQQSDCKKYGFIFTNQIYSKVDLEQYKSDEQESDVYFVGAEKGRMSEIYDTFSYLTGSGLKCDFTVIVKPNELVQYKHNYSGIDFRTERISYTDILKKIAKTKCIVELCQSGQDGLTMRFYEALFYNKMLITNNITATHHEFYNPQYMQKIETVEDIDVKVIKEVKNINYNYKNQLSPIHFMNSLVE